MKVGMACMSVHVLGCLEEELAWATDKQLQVVSNNYYVIQNSYITKKLKNKAVLSLNYIVCIAMWSLVTYSCSNCLVIYYQLMLHGYTIKVLFMFSSV